MITSETQDVLDLLIRDRRKVLLTVLVRSSLKTYPGEIDGDANVSELVD